MKLRHLFNQLGAAALMASAMAMPAHAQSLADPVVAHPNPESLFTSKDPKLHRNKQATLHIVRELLQCNQWSRAGEWLTDRYIQHNPVAKSGLAGVLYYFTEVAKLKPTENCGKLTNPIVAVQAEGDYVTVLYVREMPTPGLPGQTYTTTWFDTWRFVDGKADEHWDPATLPPKVEPAGTPADQAAISQLMWNYVRATDTLDADAYAANFTADGSFNQIQGQAALRDFITSLKKGQDERRAKGELTGAMYHYMTNQHVEFTGPDSARIHYYWQTVFAGTSLDQPPRLAAAGRGVDDLVRVGGRWLIRHRNAAPTDGE